MARITTNEGKESHITGKVEQTENITGWWFHPLWKILVKWDYCSKYMEKNKCSKPPPNNFKRKKGTQIRKSLKTNIFEHIWNIWIFPRIGDAPEWQCNQWIWEIWLYFHKNHLTLTFSDKVLVSFFCCFGIPIKSCAETPQPPTVLWQYGRCQYSTLTYLCLLASVHIMLTCSTHLNVYVGTFDVPKFIWTKNNLSCFIH